MSEAELLKAKEVQRIAEWFLEISRRRAIEIVESSKREAESIVREAEERAEQMISAKREEVRREASDEIARRRSTAEVKARKEIFGAQNRYLNTLFDGVREALSALADGKRPEYNYEELIEKYTLEAAEGLGADEVCLWGREKDLPLFKKVATRLSKETDAKFEVDDRQASIIGGVIARNKEDTKRYYNTLEGRLRKYWGEKMPQVMVMLFGEGRK